MHVWECGFELLSVQESLMHFLCSFHALWCRKNQNCWFQCLIFNLGLDILGDPWNIWNIIFSFWSVSHLFARIRSWPPSDANSFETKVKKNLCLRLFYINNISRSNDSLISALKINFVNKQRWCKCLWRLGPSIESLEGLPEST